MRILKHLLAELGVFLHHFDRYELVVEYSIDAAFYVGWVVGEASGVDHVVDYHVLEEGRQQPQNGLSDETGLVEEREGEKR